MNPRQTCSGARLTLAQMSDAATNRSMLSKTCETDRTPHTTLCAARDAKSWQLKCGELEHLHAQRAARRKMGAGCTAKSQHWGPRLELRNGLNMGALWVWVVGDRGGSVGGGGVKNATTGPATWTNEDKIDGRSPPPRRTFAQARKVRPEASCRSRACRKKSGSFLPSSPKASCPKHGGSANEAGHMNNVSHYTGKNNTRTQQRAETRGRCGNNIMMPRAWP